MNWQSILKERKRKNFASEHLDFPTMLLKVQSTWNPETLQRFVLFFFYIFLFFPLQTISTQQTLCNNNNKQQKHSKVNKEQEKSFFSVWEMNFNEFCWRWTNRKQNCTIVSVDWAIFISFHHRKFVLENSFPFFYSLWFVFVVSHVKHRTLDNPRRFIKTLIKQNICMQM